MAPIGELNTKKGMQVAEEAAFMCDCLEYNGIDLINGGTATDNTLENLFDKKYCTPIIGRSESVIDYALGHGMLIDVEDLSKNKSLILPVAVGPSKKRYTYNPLWDTGIPAELLEYGNDKSIGNSSPRRRIEEIKNMINFSCEDLDKLQENYDRLVMDIEKLHKEIATSGKPIAMKLNREGFYIGSVETETMANQIELVKKAKSVVDGYSDAKLKMILGLNPETFSDKFYGGKAIGGYMGDNLSQKDIDAYKNHLKDQGTAETRKEFFSSAMGLEETSQKSP